MNKQRWDSTYVISGFLRSFSQKKLDLSSASVLHKKDNFDVHFQCQW